MRRAAELLLTNRTLGAEEALNLGMLTMVVDDANLEAEAKRVSSEIARGSAQALAATKRLLIASNTNTLETQMEMESSEIAHNAHGSDAKEGISAFLEKRKPSFGTSGEQVG